MTNQEAIEDIEKNILPVVGGKSLLMAISALQAQDLPKPKAESVQNVQNEDLISRKAAIDVLATMQGLCTSKAALVQNSKIWQQIKDLPSAHQEIEERTEESAQNVPQEDLISRKAAIDAECEVCQIAPKKERGHNCTYYVHGCKEIECLRALPSAQPEIIRCKDCKYAINIGTPDMMCKNSKAWVVATDNNFGCVFAERRTDE